MDPPEYFLSKDGTNRSLAECSNFEMKINIGRTATVFGTRGDFWL